MSDAQTEPFFFSGISSSRKACRIVKGIKLCLHLSILLNAL
ncbi:hypothetical protein SLEP1_g54393 [Rubroshorea leprosula]|uniref:Uncharacterized protein n=1 Tax=Rubroshorea leprosula TaxID=152421 RepID=A0AAV5MF54_9ROSI|nr:hypothetical protein SLEP1_g54393 [Rubroshorea leprosula]